MTHPSHAHFPLFCEEGLPSGMLLSGGRFTTILDSASKFKFRLTVINFFENLSPDCPVLKTI